MIFTRGMLGKPSQKPTFTDTTQIAQYIPVPIMSSERLLELFRLPSSVAGDTPLTSAPCNIIKELSPLEHKPCQAIYDRLTIMTRIIS